MPALTVLMSVYNDAAYVGEAVQSILAQTFGDFELLVIDDGSTDGSADIVTGYRDARIRLLRNEANLGLTRSLNAGLAAARGRYIARQDADDISMPERLQLQFDALEREPELALVGSQARVVDGRGRPVAASAWRKCTTPLGISWQLMFDNAFVHTSVMFRKDVVFGRLGGYDPRFRTNQDFELWSRIATEHTVRNLDRELVVLRARAGSVSKGYSLDAIRAVGDRLVATRSTRLRQECEWDEGLRVFLTASNPAVCSRVRDVQPLVASVAAIYRRFVELYSEAAGLEEIRRHAGSLFTRVAILQAGRSPAVSLRALRAALSYDSRAVWRATPGVGARIAHGLVRPHRYRGQQELIIPQREGTQK